MLRFAGLLALAQRAIKLVLGVRRAREADKRQQRGQRNEGAGEPVPDHCRCRLEQLSGQQQLSVRNIETIALNMTLTSRKSL